MKEITIEELENNRIFEDDHSEIPPPDIVAYNELRSCADLFRMHQQKVLDIQPEFQREVVWKSADQTRFIDSLIKNLPIPSMCFALDHREQKWIVIDGLQRISTIVKFLEGSDWKLSKLDDIEPAIAGESVQKIKNSTGKLHDYYKRVENITIPITVLRCEFHKKTHMEYIFTIFHRLNTAGMKLNNQEIRNCIYGGSFNSLLKELDENVAWRRINKMKKGNVYRFTKQEIILRFFSFLENQKYYNGKLSKFLNDYMYVNQHLDEITLEQKKDIFEQTVRLIDEAIFEKKAPPKLSIAILESLLIGVGKNLENGSLVSENALKRKFERLKLEAEFSELLLREGLSQRNRVNNRLDASIRIFKR